MQAPLQARNDSDAAQTDTARTVAQKRVLADNRPEAVAQRKLAEMMNNSTRVLQLRALSDAIHNSPRMVAQRHEIHALFGGAVKPQEDGAMPAEATLAQSEEKTNNTGLPDQLKSGIESLSGMSIDHVKVHNNSDKPAQLQAHAYAQGSEIHLAPGREKHLPHETWHVVQQAQGRVRPTLQMKAGAINDDPSLEKEADMMGGKAAQFKGDHDARNLVAEERVPGVVTQHVAGFVQSVRVNPLTALAQRASAPSTAEPIVQRLATDSITQPTNNQSSVVPDLTVDQVKQITDARDAATRQACLDALLALLTQKGVVHEPQSKKIVYDPAQGSGYMAYCKIDDPDADDGAYTITVFPEAFSAPAVLYSTVRHEIIHAAQRAVLPDEPTAETDEYMHEDQHSQIGSATLKKIQSPLQEVETHVWELTHAAETGVDKDAAYLQSTEDYLIAYLDDLTKATKTLTKRQFEHWRGYFNRLIGMTDVRFDNAKVTEAVMAFYGAYEKFPPPAQQSGRP